MDHRVREDDVWGSLAVFLKQVLIAPLITDQAPELELGQLPVSHAKAPGASRLVRVEKVSETGTFLTSLQGRIHGVFRNPAQPGRGKLDSKRMVLCRPRLPATNLILDQTLWLGSSAQNSPNQSPTNTNPDNPIQTPV